MPLKPLNNAGSYFGTCNPHMESQNILKINFSHFPTDETTAQIPGKLFLMDNLGYPIKYSTTELMSYPVQLTMACLIFVMCGHVKLKIDSRDVYASQDMAVTILPGTLFQTVYRSDDAECAVIAVNPNFIQHDDIRLGVEFVSFAKIRPAVEIPHSCTEELVSIYQAIKHKLCQRDFQFREEVSFGYISIVKCTIFDVYLKMRDIIIKEIPKPSNRKEEIFKDFINLVHRHFMEERNVGFYADKLCVTPKYLSSVIHDVSGKYATEWIMELVIIEAKSKLKDPSKSIKEVCRELNFANQSFFAKYFKQHTGYTPKEFKNL